MPLHTNMRNRVDSQERNRILATAIFDSSASCVIIKANKAF